MGTSTALKFILCKDDNKDNCNNYGQSLETSYSGLGEFTVTNIFNIKDARMYRIDVLP
jgi:hypothetical protein